MNLLNKIKKMDEKIPITDAKEPVGFEKIENAVELIKLAHKINCDFDFAFTMNGSDAFVMDCMNFKDIRISKVKNQPNKVIISHSDIFMDVETTIVTDLIKKVVVNVNFLKEGNEVDYGN